MSKSLKENATHISDLKGSVKEVASDPTDEGVAGLRAGDIVYRTDIDEFRIWDGTKWWGKALSTTTSTSTSTTTTSTSTTTS